MTNELYINGKDAWLTWSARLIENSYDNLLLPANPKQYLENDFRSQAGKQVLLLNPQPQARNVQVMFGITCFNRADYLSKYSSLVKELTKGAVEFKVIPISTIFNFYVPQDGFISLSTGTSIRSGKFSVRFNEPNPKDRYSTLRTAYILATPDGKALVNESNEILTRNIR